jgi:hypothetical protein
MLKITPGKEEEFRYLQGWLAGSEWLDRLVEATEPREPVPAAFAEAVFDLTDGLALEAAERARVRAGVGGVRGAER